MDYSRRERAERYRREAERIRAVAENTRDPQTRQQLLDIARQYERLAQEVATGW